jgi:hypothetical protein
MSDARIIDHCFTPNEQDQLKDECAYEQCRMPELSHIWTVEAYEENPHPAQLKGEA